MARLINCELIRILAPVWPALASGRGRGPTCAWRQPPRA